METRGGRGDERWRVAIGVGTSGGGLLCASWRALVVYALVPVLFEAVDCGLLVLWLGVGLVCFVLSFATCLPSMPNRLF